MCARILLSAVEGALAARAVERHGVGAGGMILAFAIINNFGKARMLKYYRQTVRPELPPPPVTPRVEHAG